MPRPFSKKYNDSCILLFDFLKLLTDGNATYENVLELFTRSSSNDKSNPHVTLNKYMNTLKIFGIKVKKDNGHYSLLSCPCKIDLNADDLAAINLLKGSSKVLPTGKTKEQFENFIEALEIRYSENTTKIADSHEFSKAFSLYSAELSEQIKRCEQYCQDKFKLNIKYLNKKNIEEQLSMCSPVEVKYHKRKICLSVYPDKGHALKEIPLECIKHVEQLPAAVTTHPQTMTVVYKLKGKLIKNYQLREWETSNGLDENGYLTVINRNEDFDVLLKRLLRYGELCEIKSPQSLKRQMIELIEKTIAKYD